jgi:cytochrome P450
VGAVRAFRRDPLALLERAASYGDVVRLRVPRFEAYLLNHPDLAKRVLVSEHRDFKKGRAIEDIKRVLGEGLLTSEGDVHRRQRRLVQPIFHHERIAEYGATIIQEAERAAAELRAGVPIDIHEAMNRMTLAIVGRTLFDVDVRAGQAHAVGRALTTLVEGFERLNSPIGVFLERLPTEGNRRVAASQRLLDDVIMGMIHQRRARGTDGGDLLSMLMRAQDFEEHERMTDRQIRDEAITLFLAGHETTSNALTWTWYLLSRNPEAERALHAELDEVIGGRDPSVGDVSELGVTEAVVSESMRLFPPSWVLGRRALVDHDVAGYTIPAGAVAVVSQWLLHHDPRWWESPSEFRLSRWTEEGRAERSRFAYLPFGAGPRLCIGEPFAWMELVLVVATIARRWRFEHVPNHPVATRPVITLRPRFGMAMEPRPRDPRRAPGAA